MAGMNFMQSDIFAYFEKSGAGMKKRMQTIVTQPSATEIINDRLEEPLTIFAHTFKEPIAMRAVTAVRQGKLVLFIPKQDVAPPECLPFFRYTKGGESKVAVNMMNVVDVAPGGSTGELYYSVSDMRKFYSVLVAAYINLVIPEPSDYPVKAMEFGALMWAKMFCKILNTTIGLATSRDRYAAFFHYAVRFFLTYYIGAPAATVDAIAKATLKGNDANPYVMAIAEYLDSDPKQAAKFYGSFTGFCEILFQSGDEPEGRSDESGQSQRDPERQLLSEALHRLLLPEQRARSGVRALLHLDADLHAEESFHDECEDALQRLRPQYGDDPLSGGCLFGGGAASAQMKLK